MKRTTSMERYKAALIQCLKFGLLCLVVASHVVELRKRPTEQYDSRSKSSWRLEARVVATGIR